MRELVDTTLTAFIASIVAIGLFHAYNTSDNDVNLVQSKPQVERQCFDESIYARVTF